MSLSRQPTFPGAYQQPTSYAQQQVGGGTGPQLYGSPVPMSQNSQWPPPPSGPPPQDPWGRTSVPPQPAAPSPTSSYNPNQYGPMPGSQNQQPPPLPPRVQQQYAQPPPYDAQNQPPQPSRPVSIPPSSQPPVTSLPPAYQAEVQQNQQGWPQHPQYSNQPPTQTYNPGVAQHAPYNQYGQEAAAQSGPPRRQSLYGAAPPPPPKTYGDGYSQGPPPQQHVQAGYQQQPQRYEQAPYSASSSAYSGEQHTPTTGRPPENFPSYPSHGPPPPFRPGHHMNTSISQRPGSVPPQQQQYPQEQTVPTQGGYGGAGYTYPSQQQGQPAQDVYGAPSNTGPQQPPPQQYGQPSQQPQAPYGYGAQQMRPDQPQQYAATTEQYPAYGQSVSPQSHPNRQSIYGAPADAITQPMTAQGSGSGYPPSNAAYSASQHPGPESNVGSQGQPQNHAQHGHSASVIKARYRPASSGHQTEPVSPLHRMSMSFDQGGGSQDISGIPSRAASQISRKSVSTIPEDARVSPQPAQPKPKVTPSAFTFSSFGGPGDWEHYGEGPDEIDDTAMYGVKQDDEVKQPPAMGVELPAAPSPTPEDMRRMQEAAQAVQPTQLTSAELPTAVEQQEQPPPTVQPTPVQPRRPEPPQTSFVMGDSGTIPAQSTTASVVAPQPPPKGPPAASTSFVMDDGSGWVPPPQTVPRTEQPPPQASLPRPEHDAAVSQLQAEIEQHRSTVSQMESTLAQIHQQSEQQRQLLENESKNAQAARDETSGLRTQLEQSNMSLNASRQEVQIAQSRAMELEQKLTQAEVSLKVARDQFEAERGALQKSISESQVALADAHKMHDSEKQQLHAKVTELEATIVASTTAAAATSTERETLQKQVEERSQEIDSLKKQLEERSQEVNDTKKQLEDEKNKTVDLLPGLDPWFKGSFERFKAVLEIEASAPTTQEKLNAFIDFVNNESRLRGINMPFSPSGKPIGFQQQPAPPAQAPPAQAQPARGPDGNPQKPTIIPPTDGFVVVEHDGEYSPGGRPIMRRAPAAAALQADRARSESPAKKSATVDSASAWAAGGAPSGPSKEQYKPYRRGSLPASNDHGIPHPPLQVNTTQTQRTKEPAYQPFVYRPGGTPGAAQTPTAERVQSPALERHSASALVVPTLANVSKPENEIFIDEIVEGPAVAKQGPAPVIVDDSMLPQPLKPKTPSPIKGEGHTAGHDLSPLERLAAIVPPLKIHVPTVPVRIASLQKGLAAYPSDYAFITNIMRGWEQKAGALRRRLEEERHARQEANEARTNELFESDQIGYGDIADLEDQQKEEEFEKQAAEEREELASYSKEVFDVVYGTLQEQIGGLMDLYTSAEDTMKQGLAGIHALDIREGEEGIEVGEAMGMLLRIHAAVEERHREVVKAVAERDRRFKRTQTGPLYRRGEIAEMKRLEKGFEANDRRADVRAAVEKVERSKRLWKLMDNQAFRGVEENQKAIEEILKAVDAVTEDGSVLQDPNQAKERDAVLKQARAAIADLAANSKRLMQHFEVAEMDLNECEYDVSVSSARLDGQKPEFFAKLQGEKASEDRKLKEESLKRMKAIEDDLQEAAGVVDEALRAAPSQGQEPAVAGAAAAGGSEEEEKQRRLAAALEEAKRRNGQTV